LHFTPTSASWANAVEGFFSQLTAKRLKRGTFRSVLELHNAIDPYLAEHNANPKPFVWTKPVNTILDKVTRVRGLHRAPAFPDHPPPRARDHESPRAAVLEERRRLKIIPNAFGEKAVLNLMYGAMIRAAERWRGFERHQLEAIQAELDAEYQASIGCPPAAPQPKISSTHQP
jgi:hypothetical protein